MMDSSLGPLQSTMAAKTALRSRIGLNILETLGHGGRLRVGAPFKTTVTSLNGRAVDSDNENVQENVQRPYVKHGITKSNAFSYSSKEYHFVPPAATRGFLWDSTIIGPTFKWDSAHEMEKTLRLHKSALVEALGVIERASCFRREPGFFLGSLSASQDRCIFLDRFDSGRIGVPTLIMPRDIIVKILCVQKGQEEDLSSEELYSIYVSMYREWMQKTTTILEYPPMILKLTLEENFQPLSLEAHFISPNIEYLEIFPIPPIRVVPNVLSRDLLNPNESDPTKDKLRAGFLAIDQSRHILLITDSYSKLQNIPVVGLWISGLVTGLKDALFLQSVKSFIANQKLVKLDIGKPVILFALVDQGTLQFYEVQYHIGHSPIDLHVSQTLELGDSEMEHHVCLLLEKQDTSQNNVLCKILESELGWCLAITPDENTEEPEVYKETSTPQFDDIVSDDDATIVSLNCSAQMDVVVLPTVSAAESGTPSAAPASTNLLDVHAGSDTVSPAKESLPSKLSKSPRIENFTQYQSQSHWNYLTLLQKQLDVLREQMSYMHIQSPTILENEARAGACYPLPVPQKHSQSIGTNTSVIFPESQSRKLLQSATRRDIEIQANMDTTRIFSDPSLTLDRTGIPCFESSRRLPLDTGTNYKPFFPLSHGEGLSRLSQLRNEISLVSGNIPYSPSPGSMYQTMMEDVTPIVVAPDAIPEEEDSPETSLSKNLIVQMVSNPEKSFIVLEPDDGMETQDTHRFTPSSQFLPDSLGITKPHEFNASSIETSNFDGLSFASWEYLKRHGLVDERDGDTTHGTFQ